MVRVTGFYRWKAGAHFDHDYYRTKHMPLARQLLSPHGLLRLESDQFLVGPEPRDGDIIAATYGYFEDAATAQAALAATGQDLLKSVPNYSTITPELVMSVVTSHL
jgi:uncharacterized protein (TIGR02118 family)